MNALFACSRYCVLFTPYDEKIMKLNTNAVVISVVIKMISHVTYNVRRINLSNRTSEILKLYPVSNKTNASVLL